VKTSGDVHANPGPANETEREIKEKYAGEKMLTVEHVDPSACGSLGLTSDGKYMFAVDKTGYTCQGSVCNANQAKNTWQDWPSFQAHCHEHHKVNITNDHRKDKSVTCTVFTDADMKKCDKCSEKFYTTRNKKRHMDKKHYAHARFELLTSDSNSQESLSPSTTNSLPRTNSNSTAGLQTETLSSSTPPLELEDLPTSHHSSGIEGIIQKEKNELVVLEAMKAEEDLMESQRLEEEQMRQKHKAERDNLRRTLDEARKKVPNFCPSKTEVTEEQVQRKRDGIRNSEMEMKNYKRRIEHLEVSESQPPPSSSPVPCKKRKDSSSLEIQMSDTVPEDLRGLNLDQFMKIFLKDTHVTSDWDGQNATASTIAQEDSRDELHSPGFSDSLSPYPPAPPRTPDSPPRYQRL